MSLEKKIGQVVLFPFRLIAAFICCVILLASYPFVAVYVFAKASGSLKRRLAMAVCWPVGLLMLNKLLGLGGMDNPWLERISDWVEHLDTKPKPKKKNR